MKKLVRWLAKIFKANITEIVYKEKVIYKPIEDKLSGNITVDGDLVVDGSIESSKDIVCYKTKAN